MRRKTSQFLRGQLSIETLLIAAALLAFLAFLFPSISKLFDSMRAHSVDLEEQKFFDEVCFKAREAATLGPGTRFSFNSALPADSTIFVFEQEGRSLNLVYWFAGKNRSVASNFSFFLFAPSSNLSAGNYAFTLFNNASGIVLSAEKRG